MLQGVKGALENVVPQLFFFLLRQIGIAQDVHNTTALHNAVRTDHFSYWHDRGDLHNGNTGFFEFGRDRSTAARAGASRGGQNHGLHPVSLELLGNLTP
jgi:hypothetical protein